MKVGKKEDEDLRNFGETVDVMSRLLNSWLASRRSLRFCTQGSHCNSKKSGHKKGKQLENLFGPQHIPQKFHILVQVVDLVSIFISKSKDAIWFGLFLSYRSSQYNIFCVYVSLLGHPTNLFYEYNHKCLTEARSATFTFPLSQSKNRSCASTFTVSMNSN